MPLPRFVEIIRVSGSAQAARESPQDQRRALDRLRETRPGVLVERIDSVVSGASDERADLDRLFALLAARQVDEVRCRHLDRLTRHPDPRQRAALLGALIDAHAVIVETSGRTIDPADEMGELDATLQGWIASRERRRILERTLAARKRLAAEGAIQGRPPYARTWDKRARAWGVDAAAMTIYRRLFAEVLAGRSLATIADGLNADGLTTPRGREWTASHVSRLVRARSAIGEVKGWGRLFRAPPVVDLPTYEAAQKALRASRAHRAGPPGHHPALLRRVLSCANCGARMWVQRGGRTGDVRSFYVCSTHRATTDPGCRRWHPVEAVDAAVQALLLERVREPARLRAAAEKQAGRDAARDAHAQAERAARELRKLAGEEERLARLMRRGLLSEEVAASQLREIARLRHQAESDHAAATARAGAIERAEQDRGELAERMAAIARRLDRAGPEEWRAFVRAQFPGGSGVRLSPDGEITLAPLLYLLPRATRNGVR